MSTTGGIMKTIVKELIELIDKYWSFDNTQCHTHTWHDKQDCIEAIEKLLSSPSLPSDEEIEKEAAKYAYKNTVGSPDNFTEGYAQSDFREGAKWLRDTYHPQVDWEKCHNGGYIKINRICYEKKGDCIERKCQFFSTRKADNLLSKVKEAPDTFEEVESVYRNAVCDANNVSEQSMLRVDWEKLRDEFFKDCTNYIGGGGQLRKVNISPHDLFDWFKNKLK
jgi:hypothetical protein